MSPRGQVLLRITPNVGVWPTSQTNPLRRYLDSLDELRQFDVRLALPGHHGVIENWRTRVAEIAAHQDAELAEARAEIAALRGLVESAYKEGWQDAVWAIEAENAEDIQWSLDLGPESLAQDWHASSARAALDALGVGHE
jgi:glyoxylase-like metal-dependent hydrolase (beta-lactamase superfamily II)